jgi:acyl-ACP thioesterase
MTWVSAKQHFEIDEYPLWLDSLEVSTWAEPPKGPFCYRDFSYAYAPNGRKASVDAALGRSDRTIEQRSGPFLRGTSCWMILSLADGKPVKPRPELFGSLPFCAEPVFPGGAQFPRISHPADAEPVVSPVFQPLITDIDLNDHVNNINYVRWILGHTPPEVWQGRLVQTLDTYFVAQAKLGDNLVCKTRMLPPQEGAIGTAVECVHSIHRAEDDGELFRARTIWWDEARLCRPLEVG